MDEAEFHQVLEQFAVVRDRNSVISESCPVPRRGRGLEQSSAPAQQAEHRKSRGKNGPNSENPIHTDAKAAGVEETIVTLEANPETFWTLLQKSAEEKVSPEIAAAFCSRFQNLHHQLVHEALSLDDIRRVAKAQHMPGVKW